MATGTQHETIQSFKTGGKTDTVLENKQLDKHYLHHIQL